jgi:outer membrane protein assembly factor BamD
LGLTYLELHQYEEAVNAFEQVISRYPDSPLVDDARFQIAEASLKGTFKPGYDQASTDRAVRELKSFVRSHPESELRDDAGDRLTELQERRAEHEYRVGEFYEQRKQPASALVYYRSVIERYAQSSWAAKAAQRIKVLTEQSPAP